jgi:hypothetical protein
MTTLNADPDVDFPDDVENALTLLRLCLADLRLQIDPAHDDDLRSMIKEHLKQTRFRVATDEQLELVYRQCSEVEYYFQRSHQGMLDRLAAGATKMPSDRDDLPWL